MKIEAKDHWRHELTKLRCYLSGYNDGRRVPGAVRPIVPGEDVLHQIIQAIDEAGYRNKKSKIDPS